ncbi:cell division protein FtsQ/DivIB [Anaerosphaera multitolerans]|uniref:FtsQ-type POTRA domain-containing protein n=1 Tax=Anaerosphaera multitolerans TaxID=2487351 RepID=A0A437S6W9_9FIRM|nr:FtsQ-type POTRA domain-containing protein [Anaerosphaera multitolerans]RVU54775.1 FtsQ-type POTRA domain-containing protein [Anaerosphaera multitolerans]
MNSSQIRRMKYAKKKKRNRFIKKIILFIVLAIITLFALLKFGVFNVRTISVTGTKIASQEEIKKKSGIKVGDNYFFLTKKKRINDIKTIPIVKTASISFSFGGYIDIDVVERTPVAQIVDYTDYYILDDELKIIEVRNNPMQNLVEIVGVPSEKLKLGSFLTFEDSEKNKFLEDLFKRNSVFSLLKSVELDDIGIYFVTKDNTDVDFGSYKNIDYKFDMLEKILADVKKENKKVNEIYMEKDGNPMAVTESESSDDETEDFNSNYNLNTSTNLEND